MSVSIHKDHNGVDARYLEASPPGHYYRIEHGFEGTFLNFQIGPVKEHGVNGITNEAVLAILIHRMRILNQAFPCRENSLAITKLEEAGHWLEARTKDRLARQVEGENKP